MKESNELQPLPLATADSHPVADMLEFALVEGFEMGAAVRAFVLANGQASEFAELESINFDSFPDGYVVELAAALKVQSLEEAGLLRAEMQLGSAAEHLARLRCPGNFEGKPTMFQQLMKVFYRDFSWTARRDLGTDVLLGALETDALVEQLANLLWKIRKR